MGVNGIYGLSGSGLDIESLVKMGMSGKNKQYDKMEQQEIANTWLKEAYNDVYMDMTTYKYGTLSTYKMQSNMNAMQASSSNSGLVTATANGAAAAMNHTVTVSSVASNAYLQTTQYKNEQGQMVNYGVTRNTEDEDLKTSNQLADVLFKNYSVASYTQDGSTFNFKYKVTFAGDTESTEVNGSDIAISLKLKDSASDDAKEYTLTYTYDELFTGMASGTYTGYTGDNEALFDGGKTLNDFASAIAKTGANIQGGYDTANDTFSLYNKTSGENNIINITVGNDNAKMLFNNLNLGYYDVTTNTLGPRETFAEPKVMPTEVESVNNLNDVKGTAQSTSLKDVLGLTATSVKNDDNSYTITVKDKDKQTLGTFTKNGNTITGADATAFSMNLSNGTNSATISFTLGELFDLTEIGTKTSLSGNAGLDEFAAKITGAKYTDGEGYEQSLGITAKYDAITDSFSMENLSGQAELTALGADDSANKSAAQSLIESLNLVNSPNLSYKASSVALTGMLANVLGITSSMAVKDNDPNPSTLYMYVKQDGVQVASKTGNPTTFTNGTIKDTTLLSFDIKVGDGEAKRVDLTYGDLINFDGMSYVNKYSINVTNAGGTSGKKLGSSTAPLSNPMGIQVAQKGLEALVAKINGTGLDITAEYDSTSGKFSLLSKNGAISITDATSGIALTSKLHLEDVSPSSIASKISSGITRASATSSDDSLASVLGLTLVNSGDTRARLNSDGTPVTDAGGNPIKDPEYTVKDAAGNTSKVLGTDVAFSLKVGNGTSETEISFTYADLFDTTKSGTLKGIADFSTLVDKINATTSSTGVSATYDSATGKLNLKNSAGDAILTGGDDLGSALVSKMGLKETQDSIDAKKAEGQKNSWAGTNASVTIDGKSYNNDTNKLTVAGVTYTFLDVTSEAVGKKATISVSQDTDKIVDYMKSFVEEYNKLLDSLNEKLSEKKYSDYKPLSKRQEDEMTEKQIEKWNEKAKSGLLYHNSDIQALVSAMREAIYTKVDAVDSKYNTLSSIGITSSNTKGHLTLDTDKLKTALAEDPDCVYQLFASDQDSTYIAGSTNKNKITVAQSKLDYANTGIANRLDNIMTTHMKKISDIAGTSKDTDDQSYLGKLITQMQTKMKSFKTLMTSYENKLYKRYDAMEVALSKLNMQLGYISGSFS